MSSRFARLLATAAMLGALIASTSTAAPSLARSHSPYLCAGAISVPMQVRIDDPSAAILPGSTVQITGDVIADEDLANVRLSLSKQGPIQIVGGTELSLGAIVKGGSLHFSIPVTFPSGVTDNGASGLVIRAQSDDAITHDPYEKSDGVYAVYARGSVYAAVGHILAAKRRAIDAGRSSGTLTQQTADADLAELYTLGSTPTARLVTPPLTPLQEKLTKAIEDATFGTAGPAGAQRAHVEQTNGTITVRGSIQFQDSNGNAHPAYGVHVQVWDEDLIIDELVAESIIGPDGQFSFTFDNSDPGAGKDIYVKLIVANGVVSLEPLGGGNYVAQTSTVNDVPDGTQLDYDLLFPNTDPENCVGLLTGAMYAASYAAILNNPGAPAFLGHLPIEWPGTTTTAYYDGSHINLRPGDRFDWDVEFHEYGHYVMDTFNFEDNPGGPHNIGDCIAQVHSSKDQGVRLAWGEGWPTFFGTSAQWTFLQSFGVPNVGDASYTDTGESNFTYGLDTNSGGNPAGDTRGRGEDNEIADQRVLWDLFDTAQDSRDKVTISDQTLFNLFRGTNVTSFSGAWGKVRAVLDDVSQITFGAILTDHLIGPGPTLPGNTGTGGPGTNFSWQGNVGCPSSYSGNAYSLRFFKTDGTPAKTISVGNTTNTNLSPADYSSIVPSQGHVFLWAVEGSNTSSPSTGPYLGESFVVTLNQPPVAEAGNDTTVECTSHTTTAVQLFGSNSSDADNDPLTFTWTAPGVTFDNLHATNPTGNFPHGTTTVTLQVSDGVTIVSDQVDVHIVDTTPPVITCPDSIVVECTQTGGTPATDPAIAAFLAGASATDVCDATPVITNDGPGFFPHGITTVTFTAKDDDLNASTCSNTVHVVDTTPPTISVTLSRDVLWPPNHRMIDIAANVEVHDICDPNPTFVLTSITSNEPDNGTGDGDTANDIQGTAFGTSDVDFALRSERKGNGSGRVYTIIYTASDWDGNTASDTAYVRVPHDQSGHVLAANGFRLTGGVDGSAQFVAIVVPTVRTLNVTAPVDPEPQDVLMDPSLENELSAPKTSSDFDATRLDASRTYVGNQKGVLTPIASFLVDVNGDGAKDAVVWYEVRKIQDLAAHSTPEDGLVGMHYQDLTGNLNLTIGDLSALASPIDLPASAIPSGGDPTGSPGEREPGNRLPKPMALSPNETAAPARTALLGVYPMPAHGQAHVAYTLARITNVSVEVYDLRGARVRTLQMGSQPAGRFQVDWDGRDMQGRVMARGMYIVRFAADGVRDSRKTILMP